MNASVNAGHAGAVMGVPSGLDAEGARLADQVHRAERAVDKARIALESAEVALLDARSQLLAFTGVADG